MSFIYRFMKYELTDTVRYDKSFLKDNQLSTKKLLKAWGNCSTEQNKKALFENTEHKAAMLFLYKYFFKDDSKKNLNFKEAESLMKILSDEGAVRLIDQANDSDLPHLFSYLWFKSEGNNEAASRYVLSHQTQFSNILRSINTGYNATQQISANFFEEELLRFFADKNAKTKIIKTSSVIEQHLAVIEAIKTKHAKAATDAEKLQVFVKNLEIIKEVAGFYNSKVSGDNVVELIGGYTPGKGEKFLAGLLSGLAELNAKESKAVSLTKKTDLTVQNKLTEVESYQKAIRDISKKHATAETDAEKLQVFVENLEIIKEVAGFYNSKVSGDNVVELIGGYTPGKGEKFLADLLKGLEELAQQEKTSKESTPAGEVKTYSQPFDLANYHPVSFIKIAMFGERKAGISFTDDPYDDMTATNKAISDKFTSSDLVVIADAFSMASNEPYQNYKKNTDASVLKALGRGADSDPLKNAIDFAAHLHDLQDNLLSQVLSPADYKKLKDSYGNEKFAFEALYNNFLIDSANIEHLLSLPDSELSSDIKNKIKQYVVIYDDLNKLKKEYITELRKEENVNKKYYFTSHEAAELKKLAKEKDGSSITYNDLVAAANSGNAGATALLRYYQLKRRGLSRDGLMGQSEYAYSNPAPSNPQMRKMLQKYYTEKRMKKTYDSLLLDVLDLSDQLSKELIAEYNDKRLSEPYIQHKELFPEVKTPEDYVKMQMKLMGLNASILAKGNNKTKEEELTAVILNNFIAFLDIKSGKMDQGLVALYASSRKAQELFKQEMNKYSTDFYITKDFMVWLQNQKTGGSAKFTFGDNNGAHYSGYFHLQGFLSLQPLPEHDDNYGIYSNKMLSIKDNLNFFIQKNINQLTLSDGISDTLDFAGQYINSTVSMGTAYDKGYYEVKNYTKQLISEDGDVAAAAAVSGSVLLCYVRNQMTLKKTIEELTAFFKNNPDQQRGVLYDRYEEIFKKFKTGLTFADLEEDMRILILSIEKDNGAVKKHLYEKFEVADFQQHITLYEVEVLKNKLNNVYNEELVSIILAVYPDFEAIAKQIDNETDIDKKKSLQASQNNNIAQFRYFNTAIKLVKSLIDSEKDDKRKELLKKQLIKLERYQAAFEDIDKFLKQDNEKGCVENGLVMSIFYGLSTKNIRAILFEPQQSQTFAVGDDGIEHTSPGSVTDHVRGYLPQKGLDDVTKAFMEIFENEDPENLIQATKWILEKGESALRVVGFDEFTVPDKYKVFFDKGIRLASVPPQILIEFLFTSLRLLAQMPYVIRIGGPVAIFNQLHETIIGAKTFGEGGKKILTTALSMLAYMRFAPFWYQAAIDRWNSAETFEDYTAAIAMFQVTNYLTMRMGLWAKTIAIDNFAMKIIHNLPVAKQALAGMHAFHEKHKNNPEYIKMLDSNMKKIAYTAAYYSSGVGYYAEEYSSKRGGLAKAGKDALDPEIAEAKHWLETKHPEMAKVLKTGTKSFCCVGNPIGNFFKKFKPEGFVNKTNEWMQKNMILFSEGAIIPYDAIANAKKIVTWKGRKDKVKEKVGQINSGLSENAKDFAAKSYAGIGEHPGVEQEQKWWKDNFVYKTGSVVSQAIDSLRKGNPTSFEGKLPFASEGDFRGSIILKTAGDLSGTNFTWGDYGDIHGEARLYDYLVKHGNDIPKEYSLQLNGAKEKTTIPLKEVVLTTEGESQLLIRKSGLGDPQAVLIINEKDFNSGDLNKTLTKLAEKDYVITDRVSDKGSPDLITKTSSEDPLLYGKKGLDGKGGEKYEQISDIYKEADSIIDDPKYINKKGKATKEFDQAFENKQKELIKRLQKIDLNEIQSRYADKPASERARLIADDIDKAVNAELNKFRPWLVASIYADNGFKMYPHQLKALMAYGDITKNTYLQIGTGEGKTMIAALSLGERALLIRTGKFSKYLGYSSQMITSNDDLVKEFYLKEKNIALNTLTNRMGIIVGRAGEYKTAEAFFDANHLITDIGSGEHQILTKEQIEELEKLERRGDFTTINKKIAEYKKQGVILPGNINFDEVDSLMVLQARINIIISGSSGADRIYKQLYLSKVYRKSWEKKRDIYNEIFSKPGVWKELPDLKTLPPEGETEKLPGRELTNEGKQMILDEHNRLFGTNHKEYTDLPDDFFKDIEMFENARAVAYMLVNQETNTPIAKRYNITIKDGQILHISAEGQGQKTMFFGGGMDEALIMMINHIKDNPEKHVGNLAVASVIKKVDLGEKTKQAIAELNDKRITYIDGKLKIDKLSGAELGEFFRKYNVSETDKIKIKAMYVQSNKEAVATFFEKEKVKEMFFPENKNRTHANVNLFTALSYHKMRSSGMSGSIELMNEIFSGIYNDDAFLKETGFTKDELYSRMINMEPSIKDIGLAILTDNKGKKYLQLVDREGLPIPKDTKTKDPNHLDKYYLDNDSHRQSLVNYTKSKLDDVSFLKPGSTYYKLFFKGDTDSLQYGSAGKKIDGYKLLMEDMEKMHQEFRQEKGLDTIAKDKIFPKYNKHKKALKQIFVDVDADNLKFKDGITVDEINKIFPKDKHEDFREILKGPLGQSVLAIKHEKNPTVTIDEKTKIEYMAKSAIKNAYTNAQFDDKGKLTGFAGGEPAARQTVLVTVDDIKVADKVHAEIDKMLKDAGIKEGVLNATAKDGDDKIWENKLNAARKKGMITVNTRIQRGIDHAMDAFIDEINGRIKAGNCHVIVGGLNEYRALEVQIFGRGPRSGLPGSFEIVFSVDEVNIKDLAGKKVAVYVASGKLENRKIDIEQFKKEIGLNGDKKQVTLDYGTEQYKKLENFKDSVRAYYSEDLINTITRINKDSRLDREVTARYADWFSKQKDQQDGVKKLLSSVMEHKIYEYLNTIQPDAGKNITEADLVKLKTIIKTELGLELSFDDKDLESKNFSKKQLATLIGNKLSNVMIERVGADKEAGRADYLLKTDAIFTKYNADYIQLAEEKRAEINSMYTAKEQNSAEGKEKITALESRFLKSAFATTSAGLTKDVIELFTPTRKMNKPHYLTKKSKQLSITTDEVNKFKEQADNNKALAVFRDDSKIVKAVNDAAAKEAGFKQLIETYGQKYSIGEPFVGADGKTRITVSFEIAAGTEHVGKVLLAGKYYTSFDLLLTSKEGVISAKYVSGTGGGGIVKQKAATIADISEQVKVRNFRDLQGNIYKRLGDAGLLKGLSDKQKQKVVTGIMEALLKDAGVDFKDFKAGAIQDINVRIPDTQAFKEIFAIVADDLKGIKQNGANLEKVGKNLRRLEDFQIKNNYVEVRGELRPTDKVGGFVLGVAMAISSQVIEAVKEGSLKPFDAMKLWEEGTRTAWYGLKDETAKYVWDRAIKNKYFKEYAEKQTGASLGRYYFKGGTMAPIALMGAVDGFEDAFRLYGKLLESKDPYQQEIFIKTKWALTAKEAGANTLYEVGNWFTGKVFKGKGFFSQSGKITGGLSLVMGTSTLLQKFVVDPYIEGWTIEADLKRRHVDYAELLGYRGKENIEKHIEDLQNNKENYQTELNEISAIRDNYLNYLDEFYKENFNGQSKEEIIGKLISDEEYFTNFKKFLQKKYSQDATLNGLTMFQLSSLLTLDDKKQEELINSERYKAFSEIKIEYLTLLSQAEVDEQVAAAEKVKEGFGQAINGAGHIVGYKAVITASRITMSVSKWFISKVRSDVKKQAAAIIAKQAGKKGVKKTGGIVARFLGWPLQAIFLLSYAGDIDAYMYDSSNPLNKTIRSDLGVQTHKVFEVDFKNGPNKNAMAIAQKMAMMGIFEKPAVENEMKKIYQEKYPDKEDFKIMYRKVIDAIISGNRDAIKDDRIASEWLNKLSFKDKASQERKGEKGNLFECMMDIGYSEYLKLLATNNLDTPALYKSQTILLNDKASRDNVTVNLYREFRFTTDYSTYLLLSNKPTQNELFIKKQAEYVSIREHEITNFLTINYYEFLLKHKKISTKEFSRVKNALANWSQEFYKTGRIPDFPYAEMPIRKGRPLGPISSLGDVAAGNLRTFKKYLRVKVKERETQEKAEREKIIAKTFNPNDPLGVINYQTTNMFKLNPAVSKPFFDKGELDRIIFTPSAEGQRISKSSLFQMEKVTDNVVLERKAKHLQRNSKVFNVPKNYRNNLMSLIGEKIDLDILGEELNQFWDEFVLANKDKVEITEDGEVVLKDNENTIYIPKYFTAIVERPDTLTPLREENDFVDKTLNLVPTTVNSTVQLFLGETVLKDIYIRFK